MIVACTRVDTQKKHLAYHHWSHLVKQQKNERVLPDIDKRTKFRHSAEKLVLYTSVGKWKRYRAICVLLKAVLWGMKREEGRHPRDCLFCSIWTCHTRVPYNTLKTCIVNTDIVYDALIAVKTCMFHKACRLYANTLTMFFEKVNARRMHIRCNILSNHVICTANCTQETECANCMLRELVFQKHPRDKPSFEMISFMIWLIRAT